MEFEFARLNYGHDVLLPSIIEDNAKSAINEILTEELYNCKGLGRTFGEAVKAAMSCHYSQEAESFYKFAETLAPILNRYSRSGRIEVKPEADGSFNLGKLLKDVYCTAVKEYVMSRAFPIMANFAYSAIEENEALCNVLSRDANSELVQRIWRGVFKLAMIWTEDTKNRDGIIFDECRQRAADYTLSEILMPS